MSYSITSTHFLSSLINGFASLNNQQKRALTVTVVSTAAVAAGCFALYYHMQEMWHPLGDKNVIKKIENTSISGHDHALSELNLDVKQEVVASERAPVAVLNDDISRHLHYLLQNREDAQAYLNLAACLSDGTRVEIDGVFMDKEALKNVALNMQSLFAEWEETDSGNSSPKSEHSSIRPFRNQSALKQGFSAIVNVLNYLKLKTFG